MAAEGRGERGGGGRDHVLVVDRVHQILLINTWSESVRPWCHQVVVSGRNSL